MVPFVMQPSFVGLPAVRRQQSTCRIFNAFVFSDCKKCLSRVERVLVMYKILIIMLQTSLRNPNRPSPQHQDQEVNDQRNQPVWSSPSTAFLPVVLPQLPFELLPPWVAKLPHSLVPCPASTLSSHPPCSPNPVSVMVAVWCWISSWPSTR